MRVKARQVFEFRVARSSTSKYPSLKHEKISYFLLVSEQFEGIITRKTEVDYYGDEIQIECKCPQFIRFGLRLPTKLRQNCIAWMES